MLSFRAMNQLTVMNTWLQKNDVHKYTWQHDGQGLCTYLQERLQTVAEDQLPDSQCGFRKGRGCADMLFCARQLVEKTYKHNTKMFLLFVDLRKAYDSVPRQAMWLILSKYGVPSVIVELLKTLHDNTTAEVKVNGTTTPQIEVNNGLR